MASPPVGTTNGSGNRVLSTNSPLTIGLAIAIIGMLAGAIGGYAGNLAKASAHISNDDIHWSGGKLAEKFVTNEQMIQYLSDLKSDLADEAGHRIEATKRLEEKMDAMLKLQRDTH